MSLTVTSEDLVDKGNQIIQLYNQYLGRDPLQGGLDGWLATGQSIEQIEQGIANSPEAGVFQTFNETVGRDPTMEERDYFVNVNPAPIEVVEGLLSNLPEAKEFQTQQQLDETDLLSDTTAGDTTLDDTTVDGETETAFPTADTGRFGDMIDADATFADANKYLGVNKAQWSAFVNEVNEIKAQMNAFDSIFGTESRVMQDRSTPDAILDRRIAVLLNQNPGMTVDEARAEAESGEAQQALDSKIDQYNNLNEQLNQAYESIGLPGAARITGSGISGEGYAIDFDLNTGKVTYREVGGSSFFETALAIGIAAVFTGPLAGAIAGATGATAAVATAAASGIVNTATQLAMTGDLNVTQALSAAATGYLNPSASANVMSNPDIASITQQISSMPFSEVTGPQILGELTNASVNSGAVVDAISQAVGAAATNAIFGGDAESSVTSAADDELGIKNDDGTITYSVFNLPSIYKVLENGDVVHTESGTVMATRGEYDVSPYGARVTFPPYTPDENKSGGGGDTAAGADTSVDGGDASGAEPTKTVTAGQPTTVTVDPSVGGDSPVIGTTLPSPGTTEDPGEFRNVEFYKVVNGIVFLPSPETGTFDENGVWQGEWEPRPDMGNIKIQRPDGSIVEVKSLPDGTYGEHGEDIGTTRDPRTPTEQSDIVKAADWILVNLPNYKDMTEVEVNQALEGAGLEPVDINNDGTITSKSEAVATANGNQASTVTVDGSGAGAGVGAGAGSGNGAGAGSGAGSGAGAGGGGAGDGAGGAGGAGGGGAGTVSTGGQGGGTGAGTGTGSGDGTGDGDGDGDGLGRTGMLAGLAALPTMAQQPFEPLTQRSIRFDAPTIQPVQMPASDAVLALNMQIERLTGDPRRKPKGASQKGLFEGIVA